MLLDANSISSLYQFYIDPLSGTMMYVLIPFMASFHPQYKMSQWPFYGNPPQLVYSL